MPPSATNSETVFLYGVWAISLALVFFSLIMLFYVIALKIVRKNERSKEQKRRTELSHVMHSFFHASITPGDDILPPLSQSDMPIVCGIAFDMFRVVRGADVARLIDLLNRWKVRDYLNNNARSMGRGQSIRSLVLLARFMDNESLKTLFDCANAKDPYVQITALRGIAARKDPEHLAMIVQSLMSSPNQRNIMMLSEILKMYREKAVPHLLALARSQAVLEVRLAAIHALAAISSQNSLDGLIELSKVSETDIRAQSLVALGKIGSKAAEETVTRNLHDSHYGVRVAAAQAAGALGLGRATPVLMEMLKDPVWWVRYRAASALYQIGVIGIDALRMKVGSPGVEGEIAYQVLAEREGIAA